MEQATRPGQIAKQEHKSIVAKASLLPPDHREKKKKKSHVLVGSGMGFQFSSGQDFNNLCADDQWHPLISLLSLGIGNTAPPSTFCTPRNRNHQPLSPDYRASDNGYRASRPVPNAGKGLGLDMLPTLPCSGQAVASGKLASLFLHMKLDHSAKTECS